MYKDQCPHSQQGINIDLQLLGKFSNIAFIEIPSASFLALPPMMYALKAPKLQTYKIARGLTTYLHMDSKDHMIYIYISGYLHTFMHKGIMVIRVINYLETDL